MSKTKSFVVTDEVGDGKVYVGAATYGAGDSFILTEKQSSEYLDPSLLKSGIIRRAVVGDGGLIVDCMLCGSHNDAELVQCGSCDGIFMMCKKCTYHGNGLCPICDGFFKIASSSSGPHTESNDEPPTDWAEIPVAERYSSFEWNDE